MEQLKQQILAAWANRDLLKETVYQDAVRAVIEEVDKGRLRVAAPAEVGWQVNEWVKQAILLYFAIQPMQTWDLPPFSFYDKMLLKKDFKEIGVRAVPHAIARYGAYLAPQIIQLQPALIATHLQYSLHLRLQWRLTEQVTSTLEYQIGINLVRQKKICTNQQLRISASVLL